MLYKFHHLSLLFLLPNTLTKCVYGHKLIHGHKVYHPANGLQVAPMTPETYFSIVECPISFGMECAVKTSDVIYFFWESSGEDPDLPQLKLETCFPWPSQFQLYHHPSDKDDWLKVSPSLKHRVLSTQLSVSETTQPIMTHLTLPAFQMGFQTLWFKFKLKRVPTIIQCRDQKGKQICMWAK